MNETVLAVRAEDLETVMKCRRFLALPREEVEHHFGSIEVMEVERTVAESATAFTQLVAFTAVHFNYSWVTYSTVPSEFDTTEHAGVALGVRASICGNGSEHLFLDEYGLGISAASLAERLLIPDKPDLRLAGLLRHDSRIAGGARLGLVYVARLRQRVVESRGRGLGEIRLHGAGDLLERYDDFDAWSQAIIDNLQAF
jgi:predicted NUDIX family phosphoesterase